MTQSSPTRSCVRDFFYNKMADAAYLIKELTKYTNKDFLESFTLFCIVGIYNLYPMSPQGQFQELQTDLNRFR
jgi:hypothetical protein